MNLRSFSSLRWYVAYLLALSFITVLLSARPLQACVYMSCYSLGYPPPECGGCTWVEYFGSPWQTEECSWCQRATCHFYDYDTCQTECYRSPAQNCLSGCWPSCEP